tara:strand:+ start:249 stop:710 length:462 start_codon:yes stop_codon:yes gene_type:complete
MKLLQGLQKLKKGIETNNTSLIEEGYFLLTGEKINFRDDPETVEKVSVPIEAYTPEPENVQLLEPDFTMDKHKLQAKKKEFVNNFDPGLDTEAEEGYELVNDNVKPVERKRKPHKNVSVFCQDCQKNIEINPQFKREPYFCDFIKLGQKCPNS